MVKLNRINGHKMGETYASGKQKSAEVFRKSERLRESRERESAEGSENSVRIVALAVRVLGCLTVRASRNSIFVGCVNAFLAAALSRVMRAAGHIPVVAASVLYSTAVGGFVAGDVGPL